MVHLQAVADQASSSVVERLLAAEADDALRLVDVVRQRYDVVLMNPPFGEPVPETKPYLRAAYPWLPTKDYNLLAAFVGRGIQLCKRDGYLGAITSRAGMFLATFEQWRRQILLGNRLVTSPTSGSESWSKPLSRPPRTSSAQVVRRTPTKPPSYGSSRIQTAQMRSALLCRQIEQGQTIGASSQSVHRTSTPSPGHRSPTG